MSYLYEHLESKDANGRKPLIGQPKPETAEGMRVVTPTALRKEAWLRVN
jgi:hypothetical protein